MARGSLLIQQKGNQWPPSCFFWSYPASVYPVKNPSAPACQSPKKKKPRHRGDEAGRDEAVGAPASEERFEARNSDSKKKKRSHIFIVSSALKIPELDSHRLLSGLKELCKYTSPSISFLLHFVFLPHPSVKAAAPPVLLF